MRVRVRFRFNAASGEVELFQVEDVDAGRAGGARTPGAEHDAEHDRISAEIGAVAASRPEVEEVLPAGAAFPLDASLWSGVRRVEEDERQDWEAEDGERGAQ
ncbi:hypothetical protein [Streptomyces sp. NPDC048191]|uniref:hypothetical protein n=1 Tax=Streptomyces sp. NPDC048191 TaxID=3155484 RepID=UPI0033D74A78